MHVCTHTPTHSNLVELLQTGGFEGELLDVVDGLLTHQVEVPGVAVQVGAGAFGVLVQNVDGPLDQSLHHVLLEAHCADDQKEALHVGKQ